MAETKTYNEVFNYLRDNEYPIDFSKDQKRNLRKKALSKVRVVLVSYLFFRIVLQQNKKGFGMSFNSSNPIVCCHLIHA